MNEELVEIIEEVFTSDEDIVNDLTETNVIEEPEDTGTIPDADTDTGDSGGDTSPEIVEIAEAVDPDDEDIITPEEENDLSEPAVVAEEVEPQPIISNSDTLPTIGNVKAGDRVMIALVNGEAVVLGTVGSGDTNFTHLDNVAQLVAENTNDLERTNERIEEFSENVDSLQESVWEHADRIEDLSTEFHTFSSEFSVNPSEIIAKVNELDEDNVEFRNALQYLDSTGLHVRTSDSAETQTNITGDGLTISTLGGATIANFNSGIVEIVRLKATQELRFGAHQIEPIEKVECSDRIAGNTTKTIGTGWLWIGDVE